MKQYRQAVIFISIFIGLYLLLNTLYGFYISLYSPEADQLTRFVSNQAAFCLSYFHDSIRVGNSLADSRIPIMLGDQNVIHVYEGCNGANVVIVFTSFLAAFSYFKMRALVFWLAGISIIYVMNLLRVILLFEVAYVYPQGLYFFHKYLFTALLYGVVFLMWFVWMKRIRLWNGNGSSSEKTDAGSH